MSDKQPNEYINICDLMAQFEFFESQDEPGCYVRQVGRFIFTLGTDAPDPATGNWIFNLWRTDLSDDPQPAIDDGMEKRLLHQKLGPLGKCLADSVRRQTDIMVALGKSFRVAL